MQRLKAKSPPVPVDDVAAMIVWYSRLPAKSQERLTPAFRSRILELRSSGGGGVSDDPDFLEFERGYRPDADPQESLATFQRNRAFWAFKLDKAQRARDESAIDFATKQLIRFESAIHDAQLRAQRLGIDQGSIISQAECERIVRGLGFWLMRGLDHAALEIVGRIAGATATGPSTPEELRQYIEPALLNHCFLTPLVRATQVRAATSLPKWVPAVFRETVDASIEDGAQLFDALEKTPPPALAAPPSAPSPAPPPAPAAASAPEPPAPASP